MPQEVPWRATKRHACHAIYAGRRYHVHWRPPKHVHLRPPALGTIATHCVNGVLARLPSVCVRTKSDRCQPRSDRCQPKSDRFQPIPSPRISRNLSKTLTSCSFLCIGCFLGFSVFSDFFSLQPLGWALCGQHHKKLIRRVLGTPASSMSACFR